MGMFSWDEQPSYSELWAAKDEARKLKETLALHGYVNRSAPPNYTFAAGSATIHAVPYDSGRIVLELGAAESGERIMIWLTKKLATHIAAKLADETQ